MEFQDSSLIRIMCNDSVLKERGITENMLEECVIRAYEVSRK